ncbi:hypothetical protein LCGC14_2330580 [marine sediment metagenome]|uniref:Uncharacterized protein n=1 Tax=marine sediment metagenome TaxID=412755 RepID=A0A0F9CEY6_9ZZZZ
MPSNNNYAKGRNNEIRSRKWLEGRGYVVIRAAGSKGAWDLVGISKETFILVQVKTNRWPSPAERITMQEFSVPENCARIIHRWDHMGRKPRIMEVHDSFCTRMES